MTDPIAHWKPQLLALAQTATTHQDAPDAQHDGAHDNAHLHRVWHNARKILQGHPQADSLVVLAASYLHDIVSLPKSHPDRRHASRLAAKLATERLAAVNFPTEKLSAVYHAIESHSFTAEIAPRTIEARIVQDADRLDALGFVGMARLFYTAGRMGTKLAHASDPLAVQRVPDDKAYALDHIEIKLIRIAASMQTPEGRELCEARLERLRAFRSVFVEEWLAH